MLMNLRAYFLEVPDAHAFWKLLMLMHWGACRGCILKVADAHDFWRMNFGGC